MDQIQKQSSIFSFVSVLNIQMTFLYCVFYFAEIK